MSKQWAWGPQRAVIVKHWSGAGPLIGVGRHHRALSKGLQLPKQPLLAPAATTATFAAGTTGSASSTTEQVTNYVLLMLQQQLRCGTNEGICVALGYCYWRHS
eukprot:GHRQ01040033.1.p1 GENE.GHRQ01040033.1~~GHRQ01040033.1.p1  ORF type:complete len:103 (-),score=8.32 GHRQ01040033.1:55-363(-)